MISQLIFYKISQLFLMMLVGFTLVKAGLVKSKDSLVLSKLSLYLLMPSVIIKSFNTKVTDDIVTGLILSFAIATLVHIVFVIIDALLGKTGKFTIVERASFMYSNAGILVIPIVSFALGEEWVIYTLGYIIVQIVFIWTHGIRLYSSKEKFDIKKIFLNVNVVSVLIGALIMISGFRLPAFAGDIFSSFADMIGPVGMIIAGMLAAEIDFGKMLKYKRLYMVLAARLIVYPVIVLLILKVVLMVVKISNAHTILLVLYLSTVTPVAATITQLSQVHDKEVDYAVVINAVTTVGCVITMPLLAAIF